MDLLKHLLFGRPVVLFLKIQTEVELFYEPGVIRSHAGQML